MSDVSTTPRGTMSPTRRLRIFEAHAGRCCLCEQKIKAGDTWTIEHLRALGLGGADTDDNCAPAHEQCRRLKDKADVSDIARAKRRKAKHYGLLKPATIPGSRNSPWKRKIDGTTVPRINRSEP